MLFGPVRAHLRSHHYAAVAQWKWRGREDNKLKALPPAAPDPVLKWLFHTHPKAIGLHFKE